MDELDQILEPEPGGGDAANEAGDAAQEGDDEGTQGNGGGLNAELQALAKDEAELQLLEEGAEKLAIDLETKFASQINTLLTEEELELRHDDDPTKFYEVLAQRKKEFIDAQIGEHEAKVADARGRVQKRKIGLANQEAVDAFVKKHPGADIAAVLDFARNDLSKRQTDELRAIPDKVARLEYVLSKMPSGEGEGEDAPPPDFGALNRQTADNPLEGGDADEAYLKSIGYR